MEHGDRAPEEREHVVVLLESVVEQRNGRRPTCPNQHHHELAAEVPDLGTPAPDAAVWAAMEESRAVEAARHRQERRSGNYVALESRLRAGPEWLPYVPRWTREQGDVGGTYLRILYALLPVGRVMENEGGTKTKTSTSGRHFATRTILARFLDFVGDMPRNAEGLPSLSQLRLAGIQLLRHGLASTGNPRTTNTWRWRGFHMSPEEIEEAAGSAAYFYGMFRQAEQVNAAAG
jgi:hypothetical protein